jgi:hypothetical protein
MPSLGAEADTVEAAMVADTAAVTAVEVTMVAGDTMAAEVITVAGTTAGDTEEAGILAASIGVADMPAVTVVARR